MCGLSCSTSTVLQPVESVVAPEIVGIGPVGAGHEFGCGTTLVVDGLQNECGVPGIFLGSRVFSLMQH